MTDYLLLILADILLALNFAATKAYQKNSGTSLYTGLLFNAALGFFSALLFFAVNGFKCALTPFSVVMALLMGTLCVAYTCLGFLIMERDDITLYTVFLMSGGMAVPYIWGLIFLGEPFSYLRTAGLIIIAAAIVMMNSGSSKPDKKTVLLCLAVFFLNGFISVISKEHQIGSSAVASADFVILTGAAKAAASLAALLFTAKQKESARFNLKSVLFTFLAAALGGASYLFQLKGALSLPATVLYPFITGGSIIFTALAGRVFFGEKPKKRMLTGIALCFLGTVLFL